MLNMSNQFYRYLSNCLFNYFDENPLKKGDRFYIQFDEPNQVTDFRDSIEEYAEKKSSHIPFVFKPERGDEFSTFSVKLKDIQSNDIYFVIVGNPDINEDYYVTLRNRAGSQSDNWENTALLIIYNEAKDSIFEGMGNLASKNMPLNINSISKNLKNDLKIDRNLKKADKKIVTFSISKLNEDLSETTIWDYESILSIIESGEITDKNLSDLRLFPDPLLGDYSFTEMDDRLSDNHSLFDKVEMCRKSGNAREELKKYFKDTYVSDLLGDDWYKKEYKKIKNGVVEPEDGGADYLENPDKLTNEGLLYWEKPASNTKAGQRRRHLIIFNDKNFDKISLDFAFTEWTSNDYLKGGSDKYAASSGKKLKVEFEVSKDKPTYRFINYYHNNHNDSHYYFYILVVNSKPDVFDSIKSNYTLSNGKIVVINDEDKIKLGCGLKEKPPIEIETENQEIILKENEIISISDDSPAWEHGDLTFELKYNNNFIPFLIKSKTKKPHPVKSYEIWNLKRQYKENFLYIDEKAIQGINKVYLEEKFKEFLDMEKQIVDENVFYGIKDINGKIQKQDVGFSDELSGAYSAILEYFKTFGDTPENNRPSLFYLNEDLKELCEDFIYVFNKEISEIENSSILADIEYKKNLAKLGRIDGDNRIMYSSLSPINIAYQLEIANQCDGQGFEKRSVSERLVPNNLIPYIFSDNDELYRPIYQNNAHEWLIFEKSEEVSIGTTNAFISKVVSEKLKQFVEHFEYLFNVNHNSPIKINIINITDDLEIVKGVSKFIRSRLSDKTNNVIPVVINIYNSIGVSSFDEFLNCNSITEAKDKYELDVSSNLLDKLDILRDVQNNISYYIHDITDGVYEYAHISFYKVTSGASVAYSDMDKMISGLSLNGLISSVASTTTPSGYRTGFGTKNISNKNNILVKSSININEILQNSKKRGINDYAKNKAIITNVTLNDEHIEELYKKSRWVTFIEPTFGIEYFDDSSNLIIIHYSDQYTSSNNYDTITVTNKDAQYKEAILRFLKEKDISILKEDLQSIIKLFNSINGEWLLNIVTKKGQYTREKLSIISAIKYALAILNHRDIIWIPLSLEEILRITTNLKLDKSQGVISSFTKQGRYNDDLLFIGLNISDEHNLRVYFHPIEVKVGKNNSGVINIGEYQLKKTYELLFNLLNQNSNKFINKFFRNFFIQQFYSNQHKLTVNEVWNEKEFNRLEKYKYKLLNDEFTVSYDLENVISKGTLMSFKEECSFERIIPGENNQIVELRENRVYNTLSKSVNEIYGEIKEGYIDIFKSSLLSEVDLNSLEYISPKTIEKFIERENTKSDKLDLRYILEKDDVYQIYKDVNGESKCFGTFDSLQQAIEVRDDLISNDWKIDDDKDSQIPGRKGKYGKFISFSNGFYSVVKVVNNRRKSFGLFKKQEDAIKLRDLLIDNEWDFTKIPPEFLTDNFKFRFSNIREERGRFIISKIIGGELKYFGTFNNKEEAIAHRNNLILNDWKIPDDIIEEEKVDEFVYYDDGVYIVRNEIDGELKIFGVFNNMSEAIEFRNRCVRLNWTL